MNIKIAVIEDHEIVREGLVRILNSIPDFEVVLEADNGVEFFRKLHEDIQIDVALIDLQMPLMDGYQICDRLFLKNPEIKRLVLSQNSTKQSVKKVVASSANGYLTKGTDSKELENAIRKVFFNDFFFDMKLSDVIREAMLNDKIHTNKNKEGTKNILSQREIEIIELICKEYNTGEIADLLNLNHRTIESHRKRIMDKIGAKNFIGVVIFALKYGIIQLELLGN